MAKITNESGASNIWLGSKQNARQTVLYVPGAITADKPGLLFLESTDGTTPGGLFLWADSDNALRYDISAPTTQNTSGTVLGMATESQADRALKNLQSTAINTSLISDEDGADNLGSSSLYWGNTYTDVLYLYSDAYFTGSSGIATLTGDLVLGAGDFTVDSGDVTLTVGDLDLVEGMIVADTVEDLTSYIKRSHSGAATTLFELENTDATGTGYVMTIAQLASSGASGGLSISNKGTSPILYLAAGAARSGGSSPGIQIPVANQVAEQLLYIDGAYLGTDDQGAIEVASTGVLIAGGNLLRLSSTGNNAQHSFIAEIAVTAGTIAGATDGFALHIDDDSVSSTSWAVSIDSAANEALHVVAGKVKFAENLEITGGGTTIVGNSTLAGKLTITASDGNNVDALVIDQNDSASTCGILVTFISDGAGVRVTNEAVDGVCYEAICGIDATTENMMYLDGGAQARWVGADDAAILKLHTDSDFANAGASMLHINRAVGTNAGSTQGSCLRIVDKSDVGDGYAVEIDSSGNVEALNVVAGKSVFVEEVVLQEDLTVGVNTTGNAGHVDIWDGATNAPAYVMLAATDGTQNYIFVDDDDKLRIHTSVPTASGDGTVVGAQTA